jgi:phosphopantetheinyl transferase
MLHLIVSKYNRSALSSIEKDMMMLLNPYECNRVNHYQDENKAHRIIGFELLRQQLAYFNQKTPLFDLQRSQFHQPYFKDSPFQFSISHSKDYVVCLASVTSLVGVDIEFEDANLMNLESGFLNTDEQAQLVLNNTAKYFFYLHTRKEAVSKALGLGIYLDHHTIDVLCDSLAYQHHHWFLTTTHIIDNYTLSYATTLNNMDINISEIEF